MSRSDQHNGGLEVWRTMLTPEIAPQVGALWGKSNAGGTKEEPRAHLLLQHLFDSLAVGELLWDFYLASSVRHRLDEATGGQGRRFLAWLCGLHDVGKATPAFQGQVDRLRGAVEAAGLPAKPGRSRWKHAAAGGRVVADVLKSAWLTPRGGHHQWVWPLIAGHHGVVPKAREIRPSSSGGDPHGIRSPAWGVVQRWLVDAVTVSAGFPDLAAAEPVDRPSRADQLLLSGLVIMADWIASNDRHFEGIGYLDEVTVAAGRQRATAGWDALGLRGGWRDLPEPGTDVIQPRFGFPARPAQSAVIQAARAMPAPGLLVVEAPMGEGKTEAALGAAEVLAARFGADGLFVGMPTQATSDPMFGRVRDWLQKVAPDVPVALLHGRSRFNPEWDDLRRARGVEVAGGNDPGLDDYDLADPYGSVDQDHDVDECRDNREGRAAAEWFLESKRGLLAPLVIGTIDQLLFAATGTKHVMLRYAGLAGKVVILDEVHAADEYMSQFLAEALAWLGEGQVPVVLLSATLAPEQRRQLVTSYLAGALATRPHKLTGASELVPNPPGYPSVTTAWTVDGQPRVQAEQADAWRASLRVAVDVLAETEDDPLGPVVATVERELADGGCALVIRNTVARAQETFAALSATFPDQVVLLHSRLTAADRADRTERLLRQLGGDGDQRPHRLVVVATQVAEQSFDVDADLLVTDLAPTDLLLQRAGRLHRHDRPVGQRPSRLRQPRMLVTGFGPSESDGPPWLPGGSIAVYGRYLLLVAAAQVMAAAATDGWSIPGDVPELVAEAYARGPSVSSVPAGWTRVLEQAWRDHKEALAAQVNHARRFVLASSSGPMSRKDLQGLHAISASHEEHVRVRDGDAGEEVLLVRREGERLRSWGGVDLGLRGEAVPPGESDAEILNSVLGGLVRLPARPSSLVEEAKQLRTLAEWHDRRWLKHVQVAVLGERDQSDDLPSFVLRYDRDVGLSVERRS